MSTVQTSPPSAEALNFERLIVRDPELLAKIRHAYASTYYRPEDAPFLASDAGKWDLDFNTFTRYNQSVRVALPWVSRVFPLAGKSILEVGCGTGSSTAAFAQVARSVHTCDVNPRGLPAAGERFKLLGIENVTIDAVGAPAFFDVARSRYGAAYDMVLLFAVLEHQTLDERIETLRQSWSVLEPGGVLVVIETPNRLCYLENHTTQLPFYGVLPPEMAVRLAHQSRGEAFRLAMDANKDAPREALELDLVRWGRGISYHDFDLAIAREQYTVIADGYEQEMSDLFPVTYDERLLQAYFAFQKLDVSPAFCRSVLCMILRKDGGKGVAPARAFSPLVGSSNEIRALRDRVPHMKPEEIQRWLDHMIERGTGTNYWSLG